MPAPPRDKRAAWKTTSELGWSEPRLRHELRSGRPFRTFPPGHEHEIDWSARDVNLDVQGSVVTFTRGAFGGPGLGFDRPTVGIEVLWDAWPDAEVTPLPANAPAATPRLGKRVSAADEEKCFRDIWAEHPDDPLSEAELLAEMNQRLGAPPVRDRVRKLWKAIAPKWKRPRGHPSNRIYRISANKSAV